MYVVLLENAVIENSVINSAHTETIAVPQKWPELLEKCKILFI